MKEKIIGFGSLFCPIYALLMVITITFMPMFVDMESEIPVALRPAVGVCMVLLLLSVIGTWFFIIYDIVHVARKPDFSGSAKVGWICAIWFLNMFAIPIYWMKYLRSRA